MTAGGQRTVTACPEQVTRSLSRVTGAAVGGPPYLMELRGLSPVALSIDGGAGLRLRCRLRQRDRRSRFRPRRGWVG